MAVAAGDHDVVEGEVFGVEQDDPAVARGAGPVKPDNFLERPEVRVKIIGEPEIVVAERDRQRDVAGGLADGAQVFGGFLGNAQIPGDHHGVRFPGPHGFGKIFQHTPSRAFVAGRYVEVKVCGDEDVHGGKCVAIGRHRKPVGCGRLRSGRMARPWPAGAVRKVPSGRTRRWHRPTCRNA